MTVTGGQTNTTGDFGYYVLPAALGNFVWSDLDNDGIQDPGESGISNAVVTLTIIYPNAVTSTVTAVTASNGRYTFGNLLLDEDLDGVGAGEATYSIAVTVPDGYLPGLINQGGDDAVDGDNYPGQSATPLKGTTDDTYDFNFVRPGMLGSFIWEDIDGDGVQDAGEPGFTNVTVRLLDASSNLLETVVTDVSGAYLFTNLLPATYLVQVIAPTQFVFAVRDTATTNDLYDSDTDVAGWMEPVVISSGETNLTRDAGLTRPALIYGYAFTDINTNLVHSFTKDYPIANMTVTLWRAGMQVASTLTSADGEGRYEFNNLMPGDYSVRFSGPTNQLISVPTTPPASTDPERNRAAIDGAGNIFIAVSVAPGEGILTPTEPRNAGFLPPERPLSSSVFIRAYAAADGIRVEFTTAGEMGYGMITLWVWLDGKWVELGSKLSMGFGSNTYSFLAPGLKAGEEYYFLIEDEVGYLYDLYGVPVTPFAMEMQLMDRAGLRLAWESIPGRRYEIYTTKRLGDAWTFVESVMAESERASLDVTIDPQDRQRFFKIVMIRENVIE